MNWYSVIKLAQIWQPTTIIDEAGLEDEYSAEDKIRAFYELEYKYSMIKMHPWKAHTKRKENILKKLTAKIASVCNGLKGILDYVFSDWLSKHALTDPVQWSKARIHDTADFNYYADTGNIKDLFIGPMHEWWEFLHPNQRGYMNHTVIEAAFIRELSKHINDMPSLKSMLSDFLHDHKEMLTEDLLSEGFEEFGNRMGQQFQDEVQAQSYIDGLAMDTMDLSEFWEISGIDNLDTLSRIAYSTGVWEELLIDINSKMVFPMWFDKWSAEGIEDTRATIEDIYQNLEMSNDGNIEHMCAAVNAALHAAHQNGDMIEYISQMTGEELAPLLKEESNKANFDEWNNQLRAIGVEI
jgi:hypothetical protein